MDTPMLVAQIRARLQAGDGPAALQLFRECGYTSRVELKLMDDALYTALAEKEISLAHARGARPSGPFSPPPYIARPGSCLPPVSGAGAAGR